MVELFSLKHVIASDNIFSLPQFLTNVKNSKIAFKLS